MEHISNDIMIRKVNLHTIKKFELIEKYVESWAYKLLNNEYCKKLIFIDCMCDCGHYYDMHEQDVFGTPVRVSKILNIIAATHKDKQIELYFNDYSTEKITHLKSLVNSNSSNLIINLSNIDGNDLLKKIACEKLDEIGVHYLLFYDPFEAEIDWSAILPYINKWGEVIINHMVSDPIRAIKTAKTRNAIEKYEQTYLADIAELLLYGTNKRDYEGRVEKIIQALRLNKNRKYYIATFPFFNSKNAIVYNLIHCTSSITGFRLYKKTAWDIFGGKSSIKDTHGIQNQFAFDFDCTENTTTITDESCYYIKDIAKYLQKHFRGKRNVKLSELWTLLDEHPSFPSDGFRKKIKDVLKQNYDTEINNNRICFSDRSE